MLQVTIVLGVCVQVTVPSCEIMYFMLQGYRCSRCLYTSHCSGCEIMYCMLQGYRCSRCLYTSHCYGCDISRAGKVSLQPNDHLASHIQWPALGWTASNSRNMHWPLLHGTTQDEPVTHHLWLLYRVHSEVFGPYTAQKSHCTRPPDNFHASHC